MELVVANRFRLIHCIGSGSFGEIYVANDLQRNNEIVALKLESIHAKYPQLQHESSVYQALQGGCNVGRFIWFGSEAMQNIMGIQNLGRSLDTLFNYNMNQFSMKTVLMIADQILSAIEFFHKKGFIHRDIKPENFLIGADKKNKNVIYIIDFGLSAQYLVANKNSILAKNNQQQMNNLTDTSQHIRMCKNNKFVGNAKFQSINGHKGLTLSRRDDMEAIGYLLIYLLKGSLPWDEASARRDKKLLFEQITQIKMKTSSEKLCQGLPKEFLEYLNDVKSLEFDEEPHYAQYRKIFRDLFIKMGFIYDYDFDWTGKEYANPININAQTSYSKSNAKKEYKKENVKRPKRNTMDNKANLIKNYHLRRQFPKNGQIEKAIKNNNDIFANENKSTSIDMNNFESKNISTSDVVPLVTNLSTNSNNNSTENSKEKLEKTEKADDQICIQINEKGRWHSQAQFNFYDSNFNYQTTTTTTTTENETEETKENEKEIEFFFEKENSEKKIDSTNKIKIQNPKNSAAHFYVQKENQKNQENIQKVKKNKNAAQFTTNKTYKTRNSLNPPKFHKNQKPLFEEDIFSLSSRTRLMHSKMQKQKVQAKNQPKKIREIKSENPELFPTMKNNKKQIRL